MPTISDDYRLPVAKIVLAALSISYERRETLSRTLVLPFVVLTLACFLLVTTAARMDPPPNSYGGILVTFFFNAAYYIFFTPLAILGHRIVLLGSNSIAPHARGSWTRRETRFALLLILIPVMMYLGLSLLLFLLTFPISIVSSMVQNPQATSYLISSVGPLLAMGATFYVYSRLSIIFPSIAIDEPLTIPLAWRMSRHNGFRLLAIIALFFYIQRVAQEFIPYEYSLLLFTAIAFSNILAIFGIVALSLSYSELKKNMGKG